jgi:hypothetical protein
MAKPRRKLPPVRSKTLRRKGNNPANPYPVPEQRHEDREGWPFAAPRATKAKADLSDEAQLGRPAPPQQAPAASPEGEEPSFVLRASDPLSGMLVRSWANMSAELGLGHPDAIAAARRCALQMDEWRREKNCNRA